MATTKIERAGVGFGIGRQGGSIVVDVRPHHDTISALRGVQVGFELLNGITIEQAKKTLDVLNENVIGVFSLPRRTKRRKRRRADEVARNSETLKL